MGRRPLGKMVDYYKKDFHSDGTPRVKPLDLDDHMQVEVAVDGKKQGDLPLIATETHFLEDWKNGREAGKFLNQDRQGQEKYYLEKNTFALNRRRLKSIAISFRNSDSFVEVPGMLDSGAEGTLIPRKYASFLSNIKKVEVEKPEFLKLMAILFNLLLFKAKVFFSR